MSPLRMRQCDALRPVSERDSRGMREDVAEFLAVSRGQEESRLIPSREEMVAGTRAWSVFVSHSLSVSLADDTWK